MDEDQTTPTSDDTNQDEASAFAQSFGVDPAPAAGEDAAKTDAQANGNEPAADPEPAAPQYAQITVEELDALRKSAEQVERIKVDMQSHLDKAFGKIGDVNRLVEQLRSATPAGEPVQATAEDFAEFAKDYPELADAQLAGINKVLARLRGTGAAPMPNIDEVVQQRIAPVFQSIDQTVQARVSEVMLRKEHGDWRALVGKPGDSTNAYRQWLSSQPEDYQQTLNTTWDSDVIGDSIKKFKAAQAKSEAASQRKSRLQAAVTPRGMPGNAPTESDEAAGFKAAFG